MNAIGMARKVLCSPELHEHLEYMRSEDAKRAFKEMKSDAEFAGKYFFEPKDVSDGVSR